MSRITLAALLAFSALGTGCSPTPRTLAASDANAGIDSLNARLVQAYRDRDPVAYGALYTDSAVFEWPAFNTVRGRAALEAMARSNWAALSDMDLTLIVSARRLDTNHATEFGAFEQSFRDSSGARMTEFGRYVVALARDASSGWRIDRFFGFADSTRAAAITVAGQARSLFNGKDLAGWHVDVPAADSNVRLRSPFEVRNGMLVSLGEPRGHLITDATYRDYRLEIEYRFPGKPGNAGVLVHASTPRALYQMFPKSIEVQMEHGNAGDFWCIVEDITVPNMEQRRGPRANWGITEGKERRIRNLTDGSEKPLGEWNVMVIEAVGRAIRVWVNGTLVNDGSNATADRGQLALQSEGSEVEFRKISLRSISELTAR